MARSLTAGMLSETQASVTIPAVFIQINTPSGNTYLWLGGAGSISWNGQTWVGAGRALSISAIKEAAGAQANGAVGKLSGIESSNLTLVLTNIRRYLPVKIWIGALNSSFAVIADPYQVFNGRVDSASADHDGETGTITVSAENRLITLTIPRERRYTDQDQRIERPYDGGFKTVDAMQDANTQWNGVPTSQQATGSSLANDTNTGRASPILGMLGPR